MENKIQIKVPNLVSKRMERAVADITKLLRSYEIPFEVIVDWGKPFSIKDNRVK